MIVPHEGTLTVHSDDPRHEAGITINTYEKGIFEIWIFGFSFKLGSPGQKILLKVMSIWMI